MLFYQRTWKCLLEYSGSLRNVELNILEIKLRILEICPEVSSYYYFFNMYLFWQHHILVCSTQGL